MEAIRCTTLYGGQIMMQPDELGAIKDGYLADLCWSTETRWRTCRSFRDPKRLLAVMKNGSFVKAPDIASQRAWGRAHDPKAVALWLLFGVPIAVFACGRSPPTRRVLQDALRHDARVALLPRPAAHLCSGCAQRHLAHGSLYLRRDVGWFVASRPVPWVLAVIAASCPPRCSGC